jgi:hypothetical protein
MTTAKDLILSQQIADLLKSWDNRTVLEYPSQHGSVDGMTGNKTLTEDGFPCENSEKLIPELR